MADWSIVSIDKLGGAFRLDPEYYRPEYLKIERQIKRQRYAKLGTLAVSLRKGVFNILAESYVEHGIPFYRSSNVGQVIPNDADLVYITPKRHAEEYKTALQHGDIMLAKTGNEAASVVLCDECNVSQDVVAVRIDRDKVNPFYLAVFLNTNPGILQMRRWFQGQVQMHLSLPDVREILVPLPDNAMQHAIEQQVLSAQAKHQAAKDRLDEADALLMSSLGLDNLRISHGPCWECVLPDLVAARRFDAEYFSPRYQRVLESLADGGLTIQDVAPLVERRFRSDDHGTGSSFRYIEIGALTGYGEAIDEPINIADAPSRAQWIVQPGDVITSTVRPIRRLSAMIGTDQAGCVCSSGFAVLRPADGKYGLEPEVLLTYLRLPIICEIMDLHTTASMYPAIPMDRLLRIPIRLPSAKVRTRVREKVRASLVARREAAALLADAKKAVSDLVLSGRQ